MTGIEWGAVLAWYLVMQTFSLPFIHLSARIFPALPDRGYAVSKSLAVLLMGFGSWVAYAWFQLPFSRGMIWTLWLGVLLGIGIWRARERRARFLRGEPPARGCPLPLVMLYEALFAAVFVFWIWFVAHDPAVAHTEQPMDYMFMNSLWVSVHYPPEDAWLSGFPISYYYLGYWLMVTLAKAAAVGPALAYGIGQATWYALLWVGAWGLGRNVYARWMRSGGSGGKAWQATGAGALTGLSVAFMGNVQGLLESLYALGIGTDALYERLGIRNFPAHALRTGQWFVDANSWWWWRSARVIGDRDDAGNHLEVIAEFPMFSYLLGDNHPHLLAAPFLFIVLSLALQWMVQPRPGTAGQAGARRIGPSAFRSALLAIVLAAAIYFINAWDLVSALLLASLGYVMGHSRTDRFQWGGWTLRGLAVAAVLLGGGALLLLPYLLTAQTQVAGVSPNFANPTRGPQFLVMWGPQLLACVLCLGGILGRGLGNRRLVWTALGLALGIQGVSLIALGIWGLVLNPSLAMGMESSPWLALLADRRLEGLPVSLLLCLLLGFGIALLVSVLKPNGLNAGERAVRAFLLMCLVLGLLLLYLPEILFLRDSFGAWMRMNTVFKFHYQAWTLLGVVTGLTLAMGLKRMGTWGTAAVVLPVALIWLAGAVYPFATIGGRLLAPTASLTLNAERDVMLHAPQEALAMAWLEEHAVPGAVVATAPGCSYCADHSRLSAFTGVPTLIGWAGHERQWRGAAYPDMAQGREEALRAIYAGSDWHATEEIMRRWNVHFVYVSPFERAYYNMDPAWLEVLTTSMRTVVASGDTLLLARRTRPNYGPDVQ